MELLDNVLPKHLLEQVLKQFENYNACPKTYQAKVLRILGDKHRLARLRSTLSGSFREGFMDVALSDLSFALMAVTIAEFKRNLLHDDILALALFHEDAAVEILADPELFDQLSPQELTAVLLHYPATIRVLLEAANQEKIRLHPTTLFPVAHNAEVIRINLIANRNLLDNYQEDLLEFVEG